MLAPLPLPPPDAPTHTCRDTFPLTISQAHTAHTTIQPIVSGLIEMHQGYGSASLATSPPLPPYPNATPAMSRVGTAHPPQALRSWDVGSGASGSCGPAQPGGAPLLEKRDGQHGSKCQEKDNELNREGGRGAHIFIEGKKERDRMAKERLDEEARNVERRRWRSLRVFMSICVCCTHTNPCTHPPTHPHTHPHTHTHTPGSGESGRERETAGGREGRQRRQVGGGGSKPAMAFTWHG